MVFACTQIGTPESRRPCGVENYLEEPVSRRGFIQDEVSGVLTLSGTCRATVALALVLALTVACDFPRDAHGTLDRVRNGTIRVGVSENLPWARFAGTEAAGIEPALLRQWAKQLGASLECLALLGGGFAHWSRRCIRER